jgi:hypothetical protein
VCWVMAEIVHKTRHVTTAASSSRNARSAPRSSSSASKNDETSSSFSDDDAWRATSLRYASSSVGFVEKATPFVAPRRVARAWKASSWARSLTAFQVRPSRETRSL